MRNNPLSSIAIHSVLILYSALALFPLVLIAINSFKSKKGIFRDPTALPLGELFSTKGYQSVLSNGDFPLYFGNSLTVTLISLVLILLIAVIFNLSVLIIF